MTIFFRGIGYAIPLSLFAMVENAEITGLRFVFQFGKAGRGPVVFLLRD
jgi:hypothetical protein